MNLYTFTLLKILNHGDNKEWANWLIFYIFVSTNSNELSTITPTKSNLSVFFIDSEHSTNIILKGKILVLGFNYWSILLLEFFFPVLSPANEFSCDFNILENSDIHTKLL